MREELEARIQKVVRRVFLAGDDSFPLEPDLALIENGICDSMGLVELATALEVEFAPIRIHDQDIDHDNLGTIGAAARLLVRLGVKT